MPPLPTKKPEPEGSICAQAVQEGFYDSDTFRETLRAFNRQRADSDSSVRTSYHISEQLPASALRDRSAQNQDQDSEDAVEDNSDAEDTSDAGVTSDAEYTFEGGDSDAEDISDAEDTSDAEQDADDKPAPVQDDTQQHPSSPDDTQQ